ncbi:MAG TPA: DUF2798 domain-containing protein [Bacteroidia bacterium]|jgi:hypothetical protein|nr:DUF2798 domain-containing protein [Bacteroidia bacterium]
MKNKIVFALIMGIVTTGIISFTLISVNIGFNEKFLQIWLRSWGMAYLVVIPAILIIGPQIQKLVDYLLKEKPKS